MDVDEAVVRALLEEQHRDLADLPLLRLDEGFDNELWRLGSDLVVRLPRRPIATRLILNEQRWLPELAPRLPLPVPVPVRIGVPSPTFAWPWSVLPWLGGIPAHRAAITDPARAASQLGRFLRELHRPPSPAAPRDPRRSGPFGEWAEGFEARLTSLGARVDAPRLRRVFDSAVRAGTTEATSTWIHGDLQPANVLVADGSLAGIIDFGYLGAGDPATDLAGYRMLLPNDAFADFEAEYGAVDDALYRRSLGWALLYALMFVEEVADQHDLGLAVIRRVLAAAEAHD